MAKDPSGGIPRRVRWQPQCAGVADTQVLLKDQPEHRAVRADEVVLVEGERGVVARWFTVPTR